MKILNQQVITSPSYKSETGPLFRFLHAPSFLNGESSASSLKMLRGFFLFLGWLRHKNGGDALSTNLEIRKVLHVLMMRYRRWKMEDWSRKISGSWTHGVVVALEIRMETETAPPYITCMICDTSAHFSVLCFMYLHVLQGFIQVIDHPDDWRLMAPGDCVGSAWRVSLSSPALA